MARVGVVEEADLFVFRCAGCQYAYRWLYGGVKDEDSRGSETTSLAARSTPLAMLDRWDMLAEYLSDVWFGVVGGRW